MFCVMRCAFCFSLCFVVCCVCCEWVRAVCVSVVGCCGCIIVLCVIGVSVKYALCVCFLCYVCMCDWCALCVCSASVSVCCVSEPCTVSFCLVWCKLMCESEQWWEEWSCNEEVIISVKCEGVVRLIEAIEMMWGVFVMKNNNGLWYVFCMSVAGV